MVHLAFLITGNASRETTRSINVDGTLERVPCRRGRRRRSGSSTRPPSPRTASTPTTRTGSPRTGRRGPRARLFYAQEKAELEAPAGEPRRRTHPDLALYLLRPPVVLGPERARREGRAARPARPAGTAAVRPAPPAARSRSPCSPPRSRCSSSTRTTSAGRCCCASSAAGPPGAYNIAGDGIVTAADVAREFGGAAGPDPGRPGPGRGAGHGPAAVPAARRRMGGGGQPARAHGHPEGARRAGLAARATPGSRRSGPRCARRADPARRLLPGRGGLLQPAEHVAGQPVGHLQLRHVADAGQLDVAPAGMPQRPCRGPPRPGPAGPVAVHEQDRARRIDAIARRSGAGRRGAAAASGRRSGTHGPSRRRPAAARPGPPNGRSARAGTVSGSTPHSGSVSPHRGQRRRPAAPQGAGTAPRRRAPRTPRTFSATSGSSARRGPGIAGSSRTSPLTVSGDRAACRIEIIPPIELPTSTTGAPATSSTNRSSTLHVVVHGRHAGAPAR